MKLGNLPKRLPASAFEATREFARQRFIGVANLLDVVEFGTTNLPGISDVDLIAIIKAHQAVKMPDMHEIYTSESYAPMHRPFVYSEETLRDLRCIDPWLMQIRSLLREDGHTLDDVTPLNTEEHAWLSLRFMLQWSTTLLRLIAESESSGTYMCHLYLGICIVPKYIYREMRRIGVTDEDDPHVPFYERMREEWFTLTSDQQEARMREGFGYLRDSMQRIIKLLRDHLAATVVFRPVPAVPNNQRHALLQEYPHSYVIDGGARAFVFQEGRGEAEVIVQRLALPFVQNYGGSFTRLIFVLPLELGSLYSKYLEGGGPVSRRVQSVFATDLEQIPFSPSPVMDKFVRLTDQIVDEAVNVTSAKYFFETFGLRQKTGRQAARQYPGLALSGLTQFLAISPAAALGRKTHRSIFTA